MARSKEYTEFDLRLDTPVFRIISDQQGEPVFRLSLTTIFNKADGEEVRSNVFMNVTKEQAESFRVFLESLGEA